MDPALSRAIWHRLEAVNAVTYFADECRDAYRVLGLRGFWMGYFAGRAAPLGAVTAGVVEATFFNFHPAMVGRAIPDAWSFAAPETIVSARARAAAAAIHRLAPHAPATSDALRPLLVKAIDHATGAGRPLFAANRDLMHGFDGVAALWQAATTLREHRGDGHVAVLTESGIDGCEAHVLFAAAEGVPIEVLRDNRGWSPDVWEAATDRLRARGLLERSEAQPTAAGHDLRHHIEHRTDELAAGPYTVLDDGEIDRVVELAGRLADPIVASGTIPFPNPMGLPREHLRPDVENDVENSDAASTEG